MIRYETLTDKRLSLFVLSFLGSFLLNFQDYKWIESRSFELNGLLQLGHFLILEANLSLQQLSQKTWPQVLIAILFQFLEHREQYTSERKSSNSLISGALSPPSLSNELCNFWQVASLLAASILTFFNSASASCKCVCAFVAWAMFWWFSSLAAFKLFFNLEISALKSMTFNDDQPLLVKFNRWWIVGLCDITGELPIVTSIWFTECMFSSALKLLQISLLFLNGTWFFCWSCQIPPTVGTVGILPVEKTLSLLSKLLPWMSVKEPI